MTPDAFGAAVLAYCRELGGSVTSWQRTPARNRNVGGALHSAHLVGLGCDVVLDEVHPLAGREQLAATLGLRLIAEKDHDHLQPLDWHP